MTYNETTGALGRLHHLIKRKATGTPEKMAQKFSVSVSTVKNWIDILKRRKLPVKYCREKQTYYYAYEVDFRIFWVKAIDDPKKIQGGKKNYNFFRQVRIFVLTLLTFVAS